MRTLTALCLTLLAAFPAFGSGWEWQNPLPQGNPLTDVFMWNEVTGWAVGSAGTILATRDGTNWIPQPSGTVDPLYAVHFLTMFEGWAVGGLSEG